MTQMDNSTAESDYTPISELEFVQLKEAYVTALNLVGIYDQSLKDAKAIFETNTAPTRAAKAEAEARAEELKQSLIMHAHANWKASGNKTFAGVQYRVGKRVEWDEDHFQMLIDSLDGEVYNKKPLVKVKTVVDLDKTALKNWITERQNMNQPVPGCLRVIDEPTIALIKD